MCGVAASLSISGKAQGLNLDLLKHRGPDSSGEWTSANKKVWFGHTRLSILDLSPAGQQPMVDPSTGNCIVFNGEIYNHLELRNELKLNDWRGGSDTETLLIAYKFWGVSMLEKLRGMFALLIYDVEKNQVIVARDRLGIKPLYYSKTEKNIKFSSEVRVLLNTENRHVSKKSLSFFLQYGSSPESNLLLKDVNSFPASHYAVFSDSGDLTLNNYWKKKISHFKKDSPSINVRRLLEDSVKEHLLSDVPIASFLSGGIDSSIVTALAARISSNRIKTFSVGFKEKEFDETQVARIVADRYQTDHVEIILDEKRIIELVQEAVEQMDLPSVDAINTYIVSQFVSKAGIKVALSGLGSDELFGGYKNFKEVAFLKRLSAFPSIVKRGFCLFGQLGKVLSEIPNESVGELALWRRRFWTNKMLSNAGLPIERVGFEPLPELTDDFSKISWSELSGYMRHTLLRDSDQMSMANSLEVRVPFLDHRLVSYVLGLPEKEKTKFKIPKGLLVDACRDLIPEEVYNRPKMGFVLPMKEWMKGPLSEFMDKGIDGVVEAGCLRREAISRILNDFNQERLHWNRVWSLVVLGHYLKKNGLRIV